MFVLFTLMGQQAETEVRSAAGRADLEVILPNVVYIFELKMSKEAKALDKAMTQIDEKAYALPYMAGKREVIKIGIVFDPEERNIKFYRAEPENPSAAPAISQTGKGRDDREN
jgi:hypothetical protein